MQHGFNGVCRQLGRLEVRMGVKQIQMGSQLRHALLITNDSIHILDLFFEDTLAVVRREAYPRTARLAPCQTYFVAYFTDNTVGIYETRTGNQVSKLLGVPMSVKTFNLSASGKLVYASNNRLCMWSVPKGELEMASNQWRNINCYDINEEGNKIAIGTYDGTILVLNILSPQKVSEMEIKRHKNCVMIIGFSGSQIASVSYDRLFVLTTITTFASGQKGLSFNEIMLQGVPRGLQGLLGEVFLLEHSSIGWLRGNKLVEYTDGLYAVGNYRGTLVFMRYKEGVVEWFQR